MRIVTDFVSVFQPSLPVIVDTMTNAFERAFASWPLRIYVLHRGRAVYIASANDWYNTFTCGITSIMHMDASYNWND